MTQRDVPAWYVSVGMPDDDIVELLDSPETAEESRVLDELTADPRRVLAAARLRAGLDGLRLRRQPRWIVVGSVAAAIAAAVVVAVVRTPRDPAQVLREMQGDSRPLAAKRSSCSW